MTGWLLVPRRRSVMRLKKAEERERAMVIGWEMRAILRKGSSRFSNELALALRKTLRMASIEEDLRSCSSMRAVSS